jgi:hypothetical protein
MVLYKVCILDVDKKFKMATYTGQRLTLHTGRNFVKTFFLLLLLTGLCDINNLILICKLTST